MDLQKSHPQKDNTSNFEIPTTTSNNCNDNDAGNVPTPVPITPTNQKTTITVDTAAATTTAVTTTTPSKKPTFVVTPSPKRPSSFSSSRNRFSTKSSSPQLQSPSEATTPKDSSPSSTSTYNSIITRTSTTPRVSVTVSHNPLQTDSELREMILQLDDIHKYRPFKLWKSSFLNRYQEFLTQKDGCTTTTTTSTTVQQVRHAQMAYTQFQSSMKQFVKHVQQVQMHVQNGNLSIDKTTVKGRNALNEMIQYLVKVIIIQERELIPATAEEEKRKGYTKFHLGAVLIQDGFQEYAQLQYCCDILQQLVSKSKSTTTLSASDATTNATTSSSSLMDVADKLQIEEIEKFEQQMIRFRDLMADLGLYDVMMKCWEIGKIEAEDEFIFVDPMTGAIGTISIQECLDLNLIHIVQKEEQQKDDNNDNNNNNDDNNHNGKKGMIRYQEAVTDDDEREAILDLVKNVLHIQ